MFRFKLKTMFGLILAAASCASWLSHRTRREHDAARFFLARGAAVTTAPGSYFGVECSEHVVAVEINDAATRKGFGTRTNMSKHTQQCDLAMLAGMPWLTQLTIQSEHLPGGRMADVAALTQLTALHLVSASVRDRDAVLISKLKNLQSLELDCALSDDGIASAISSMSRLRYVKLRGRIGRNTIRRLSALPLVEDLNICSCYATAENALALRELRSLKRVRVIGACGDWARVAKAIAAAKPSAVVSLRGVFEENADIRPAESKWLSIDAIIRKMAHYEPKLQTERSQTGGCRYVELLKQLGPNLVPEILSHLAANDEVTEAEVRSIAKALASGNDQAGDASSYSDAFRDSMTSFLQHTSSGARRNVQRLMGKLNEIDPAADP